MTPILTFVYTFWLQIDGSTTKRQRASDILLESIQLAYSLRKIGIKEGETVGIYSENRFEYASVVLATIYLGATITTFSPTYTESNFRV